MKGEKNDWMRDAFRSPLIVDRFMQKVLIGDGCWEWCGSKRKDGYGEIRLFMKLVRAHRFSYGYFKGAPPENTEIDHLCRNRACVNPRHLEAVTARENCLRGEGPTAGNSRKTHCSNGHELARENLGLRKEGSRYCITCARKRASQHAKNKSKRGKK